MGLRWPPPQSLPPAGMHASANAIYFPPEPNAIADQGASKECDPNSDEEWLFAGPGTEVRCYGARIKGITL